MNKAKNNQSETGQNSLFQDKLFITCQPSDWSKNTGDPENLMHSRVHSAICMAWVVRKPFEVFLLFLRNIDVNAVKKIMVCIKELKNLVEGNFNRRGKEYPIWEVGRHLDICYKQSQDESMYSCVAWPKRARRDLKIQKWSQSKLKKQCMKNKNRKYDFTWTL